MILSSGHVVDELRRKSRGSRWAALALVEAEGLSDRGAYLAGCGANVSDIKRVCTPSLSTYVMKASPEKRRQPAC